MHDYIDILERSGFSITFDRFSRECSEAGLRVLSVDSFYGLYGACLVAQKMHSGLSVKSGYDAVVRDMHLLKLDTTRSLNCCGGGRDR